MAILAKLLAWFGTPSVPSVPRTSHLGPQPQATQGPAVVNAGMSNYYEALRQSKDRTPVPYTGAYTQLRPIVSGLNRKQLAALARYLDDNGGVVSYAVGQIANYSVPVKPQAASASDDWNTAAEDYFEQWTKRADFTGRFDFYDLQKIACKAIDIDGDIAAAITAKAGFPQLRLYDCFHIGTYNKADPNDGVRVDADGVLLGYQVIEGKTDRFLNRSEITLLFDPERYDNYRGVTPIRRGSNDLRDVADIKGFEKVGVKLGSALAGVIESGPLAEDEWGNDTGTTTDPGNNPASTATPQEKKLSLAELLGGDIPVISGTLKQIDSKRPHENVINFLDYLAGAFVSGLNIPPAFFLDAKLTGPNLRAVLGKAQRKFDERKRIIARFVEWCWLRVIAWAISRGELPSVPDWWRLTFQFPSRMVIDLGDQMANEREDVASGQMTRQERFGNRGLDWKRETDQSLNEDRYIISNLKRVSTETGVPIETLLVRYGFAASKPKPEQKPQPETDQKE